MTRLVRAAAALALTGLAVAGSASPTAAAVSEDVTKLPLRRPVEISRPGARLVLLEEDSLLAGASGPDFLDLRLMDSEGEAVPLADEPLRRRDVTFVPRQTLAIRWVPGENGSRQATFDLGPTDGKALWIEVTGPSAHYSPQVMGSADSTAWYILPQRHDGHEPPRKNFEDGPVFRVGLSEVQRWLRLVQTSGYPPPSADDRLVLFDRHDIWTPREPVAIASRSVGYDRVTGSVWKATLELAGPARAITRVDLTVVDPTRARYPVQVEARLERGGWQWISLDNTPEWSDGRRDSLVFEPIRTTALRITVEGADAPNDPFEVSAVMATPRRWIFEPRPGETYWLGYGDRFLLDRTPASFPAGDPLSYGRARLGPPEPNPWYSEPGFGLDWLKRRPAVLSIAMIVTLLVVALLARKPAPR
jgi:hypothetical protein